jgi:hypothetical protein
VKEIPLTKGQVALVDDEDYERLAFFPWQAYREPRSGKYYAFRWARKDERLGDRPFAIPMHTAVLGKLAGHLVDHVAPEQTLDNRRNNLRHATHSQNGANRGPNRNNKSGFKGVSWCKQREKWRACIKIDRQQKSLGLFDKDDKELAARAYDRAAIELFGLFACVNFPGEMAA